MTNEPGSTITDVSLELNALVGRMVAWLWREAAQSISSNGTPQAANALSWDAVQLDLLGGWSAGQPTRYTPTVAGYYLPMGWVGFASSAGGEIRGSQWFLNGSAATPGQARIAATLATGTGGGPVRPRPFPMNGTTDFIELIAVHNAGSNLNTATGSNHPDMVVLYVGPL